MTVQQTTCTRPSVYFLKYCGGVYDGCTIVDSGPLHMSPVDRAGPDAGTDVTLYSYQKFQPGFRDEKGQKSWELVLARNSRNKANMVEQNIITFVTIIALATFNVVSLQLNGMLMKYSGRYCRQCETMPSGFHPSYRAEVFICQNFQPALSYEHIGNLTKDLEVRRDPGNLVSSVNWAQPGSCGRPFIRWYQDD